MSTSKAKSETALATRDLRIDLWRDPEWQRLWLSLQARPWTSLAIVPAGEGAPADFTLRVAVILSRVGMVHLGRPVQVADATNVPLAYLTQFMDEIGRCTRAGDPIILALAPVAASPLTVSIAQTADSALLCVLLERMATADQKKTVNKVGLNRFMGSAIFRTSSIYDSTPPPPSSRPPRSRRGH